MATAELNDTSKLNGEQPDEELTAETEAATDQPTISPEAEQLFEIKAARELVRGRECRLSHAKEEAKAAREDYDAAVRMLTACIDRTTQHLPLFDGKPLDGTTTPAPEAWRASSIDDLGLQPALAEKLRENGIGTIGSLEDLRAGAGLRSISGIGPAKVDKIEDAVIAWLSEHRDAEVLDAANGELEEESEIGVGVEE